MDTGNTVGNQYISYEGIETQAIAGLNVHRLKIDSLYIKNCSYKLLFDAVFPAIPVSQRYSTINAGLAIAAYERTVLANNAPFQKWLQGENVLTARQNYGAELFFGKAKCYTCHNGPTLNSSGFYALGMNDLTGSDIIGSVPNNTAKGRGGFTGKEEDNYKFKTPTLYNLKDVTYFGHGGSFTSIRDVIVYKNKGVAQNSTVPVSQLSSEFKPLNLSESEIDALTDFIENALYDDDLIRYVPSATPLNSCFPNADDQSKSDLGCGN